MIWLGSSAPSCTRQGRFPEKTRRLWEWSPSDTCIPFETMARKTHTPLTIAPTNEEALAAQRHTDWEIAHDAGRTRNGRAYIAGGPQGSKRTKQGRSRSACRGKVRDY